METSLHLDHSREVWRGEEVESKYGGQVQVDPNFCGPVEQRQCTDCGWIPVFCLVNIAFAAFCVYAYWWGDPSRLTHGWDFRSELCGLNALASKPYTYFLIPSNSTTVSICLEGCPVLASTSAVCLYETDHITDIPDLPCYDAYESKPYLNRYCLPSDKGNREKVANWLYEPMQVVTLTIGDIYRAWDVLAVAGIISAILALFYLIWLKFGRFFVILGSLSLIALWLLFAAIAFFIYEESQRVGDEMCHSFQGVSMLDCDMDTFSRPYRILSYTSGGVFLLISAISLVSFCHICKGPKFLSLSIRPLRDSSCILCVPIGALILGGALFALLLTLATFAASNASIETISADLPEGKAKNISFHIVERCLLFYEIVVILWWFSLFSFVCEFIAGSFTAFWFFDKEKATLRRAFRSSFRNLFRYHFGSVICASVIIPAFRVIKYALMAINQMKRLMKIPTSSSCFVCCDEFFLYLDYHALAYQSLWGSSFYESSKQGYFLMDRFKANTKKLISAGDFYIWTIQLVTTLSSPVFVYYWLQHVSLTFQSEPTKHISTITGLAVISLFTSWYAAQVVGSFMRGLLYSGVVCYLSDSEMFVGGQRYADGQLASLFGEEYDMVKVLKPIQDKVKQKEAEPVREEPFFDPSIKPHKPAKPPPDPESPPNLIKTAVNPRDLRPQAFETPLPRPPPLPDILRQTMSSSSSSAVSSNISEVHFFILPNVVPPGSPRDVSKPETAKKDMTAGWDSARNLGVQRSQRGAERQRGDSESDSLSSYSDSEEDDGSVNRWPIARPSSRGDIKSKKKGPGKRDEDRKGGRKG